jgi:hypothetical protein
MHFSGATTTAGSEKPTTFHNLSRMRWAGGVRAVKPNELPNSLGSDDELHNQPPGFSIRYKEDAELISIKEINLLINLMDELMAEVSALGQMMSDQSIK